MQEPGDNTWKQITKRLAASCDAAGLDLIQPLRVAWYNRIVDTAFRLDDFRRPHALAILIGNTRSLWPHFVASLRTDRALRELPHPLDRYVVEKTLLALSPLNLPWTVRFAHETHPAPVAMQRLAHVAGLAYLAPSHLNVHPVFGPWIALRAVAIVDIDGPPEPAPEVANPCDDCENRCMAAYREALAAGDMTNHKALGAQWIRWLAVRDACPVGRVYRYDDDQARYHYTKDRQILEHIAASR